MGRLNEIKKPIAGEMADFEKKFRASMASRVPLLDRITHYIVKRKGKQMRPMFVFLSAQLNGGLDESTHRAAALIELLHTATLVHDDVVDDANMRRGFFSLNALWKNKIAVLVGDYLLSRGLLLSVENKDFHLLEIVSNAVREMSEGELLQIEKARRLDIQEDIYFEIIEQKTATLIAACCAAGTASVNREESVVEKMRDFGLKVGIAFQIKDDLFDYAAVGKIGKPVGIDIKEQKMTLPLIYALQNAEKKDKRRIINTVKNHNLEPDRVKEVIDYVNGSGGIEYATKKMHEYKNAALEILESYPDSPAKTSLRDLVNYVIDRDQ